MIITRRFRLMTRHFGQRRLTLADTFMRCPSLSLQLTDCFFRTTRAHYRDILLRMREQKI